VNHRRILRLLLLATAAIAVSGCALVSEITFYGNLIRANQAGVRFRRTHENLALAVPFSDRSDVTLDLFSPEEGDGHPVLIFVHGGGWNSYDKELFTPVAMQLLPQEMVVVIPDYTLYPDATYRQMAREVADATAWVLENIHDYGGDPNRVYLSGHSAGAHLSGLVAYDSTWLAETGHSPEELRGWIGLSGVYDVAAHEAQRRARGLESPIMTAVMEGPGNFASASPISYASGFGAGRAALIHGAADETVPLAESERMDAALEQAGFRSQLIVYPEAGHSDFLFGALGEDDAPVILDIGRLVHGHVP
jgi:acetyl esterase/lipase